MMSMVKSNVKVYETTEDYTQAIASSGSSSVTFDNMRTIFAIFFIFLSSVSLLFVFSTYVVPFFAAKMRCSHRIFCCKVSTKRSRPIRNAVVGKRNQIKHPQNIELKRPPRKKRVVPVKRPMRINELEMGLYRPGLLTRSTLMESDWILRRADTLSSY